MNPIHPTLRINTNFLQVNRLIKTLPGDKPGLSMWTRNFVETLSKGSVVTVHERPFSLTTGVVGLTPVNVLFTRLKPKLWVGIGSRNQDHHRHRSYTLTRNSLLFKILRW